MDRYNQKKEKIQNYKKLYYQLNKEKLIKQSKENYAKNIEHKKKKAKEYYYNNKEMCKQKATEYRKNNLDALKERQHKRYIANKEKILLRQKKYYQEHKIDRQNYWKQYRKQHKDKINAYIKNKKANNELFEFSNRIRNLILKSIKKMGYTKNSKTYQILGCDYKTAYNYLLDTYKKNYGEDYNFKEKVHIDHIIPISKAKSQNEVIELCNYKNLQLLKEKDNLKKSNKLNWEIKEE